MKLLLVIVGFVEFNLVRVAVRLYLRNKIRNIGNDFIQVNTLRIVRKWSRLRLFLGAPRAMPEKQRCSNPP